MKELNWKYIIASEIGTSHKNTFLPCQDFSLCEEISDEDKSSILVAVVSDGAGSSIKAEIGSKLACHLFITEVRNVFKEGGNISDITLDFIQQFILKFQEVVLLFPEHKEYELKDFACTFLASVIGESSAVFTQVGDGAMVIPSEESENYSWVFWPQQGEYANTTNFITNTNAINAIEYKFITHQIKKVALFSDGIQNLALHYQTQTAYSPFFRSMFNWLSKEPIGYSKNLTSSLVSFLNSPKVNELTDDDKTLILASR